MKKIIITLSILSAFAVSAIAQQERPARPERPDAGATVKKLFADFDADKNGTLNEAELNKGLASLRPDRSQGQQGRQNARPERQRPERGERPEGQRPEAKDSQRERPSGGNMGAMFLKRNDKDGDGELNKAELTEAFKNMPQRGPQGQRGKGRTQAGK